MKTINKFLIAFFVTIFSVTSFSQVTNHTFDVTVIQKTETVFVGDTVTFVNKTQYTDFISIDSSLSQTTNYNNILTNEFFVIKNIQNTTYVKIQNIEDTLFILTVLPRPVVVGVNDLSNINFKIYPNPTTDFLNISGTQIKALQVFDVNGRLVLSETPNATNINLDVRSLETGFYTVLINDQQTIRFIKE